MQEEIKNPQNELKLYRYLPAKRFEERGEGGSSEKDRRFGEISNIDRIEDILKNNRFWGASPLDFNDPFDCLPYIISSYTREILRDIVIFSENLSREDEVKIELHVNDLEYKIKNDKFYLYKCLRDILSEMCIVCFSKTFHNLPMWAHYAGNHTGLCIEVTLPIDNNDRVLGEASGYMVNYTKNRPVFHPYRKNYLDPRWSDELFHMISSILTTKDDNWSYEQEFRIINQISMNGIGGRYIKIPPKSITKLIFGHNSSDELKNDIERFIHLIGSCIPTYDAVLDDKLYDLNLEKR